MRSSQFLISTLKEAPTEAELPSHRLMLRAGLIKRLASGLYSWMPMGLRVLRKVEAIVREEMDKAGALELLMPVVQPAELWEESGRWSFYGPELLRVKDRHDRPFCLGPTHEEVVTDIIRKEVKSYRQLPLNVYQIQTKFRDEIRPRFGVMRAREFVMKDAYSFHTDFDSLVQTYNTMHTTYSQIFKRLGLTFRAVAADTGSIGGTGSHEFHVLADSGEDGLAFCPTSDYAANIELAEALPDTDSRPVSASILEKVATPNARSIEEVCAALNIEAKQIAKAIVVEGEAGQPVLLLVRGDHELNEIKAEKLPQVKAPLTFASAEAIQAAFGASAGSLGVMGFKGTVIADRSVAMMGEFVTGANENGFHYTGAQWGRDAAEPTVADIRNVVAGDKSPDGQGVLELCRGIEVGHIFQLRTKYSEALQASYLDANGKSQIMEMGCYGIGVSRIVGAAIEQNFDEKGIRFSEAMAPFTVAIAPIGYHKSEAVKTAADALYAQLKGFGLDVLLDDRNERPGVMFADLELIGIPHRITLGDRGLKNGEVEYLARGAEAAEMWPLAEVVAHLQGRLGQ